VRDRHLIDGADDERDDGARPRTAYGDGDVDVVAGGAPPRSRKAAVVIAAAALVLVAEPVWHAIAPPSAPAKAAPLVARSPAPAPVTATPPDLDSVATPAVDPDGVPRPRLRGQDFALLRWFLRLPVARRAIPPAPQSSDVFRVRHSPGYSGAEDFGAVAQVRGRRGWVTVAHGDVGLARLDADGSRVAFTLGRASLTEPDLRSWVYLVAVPSATVLTSLRVPPDAGLVGWFGPYAVVARRFAGRSPVLLDSAGGRGPREVGDSFVAVPDGVGDAQLLSTDRTSCASGRRLGLVRSSGVESCPDEGLLALSSDGRRGLTRDLRWLDTRTGRYRPVDGRPPGGAPRSADFVDGRRALVSLGTGRRTVTVLCSLDAGCARPSRTGGQPAQR
jgi:hypothetical protein